MKKVEIMKFIDWLYDDEYMIIRACERPYPGDMSHKDIEAIVDR